MKQYHSIKKRYEGALLLFRVGDFYETFGEDAVRASKILDIVLTKRANGSASEIELAGFPHHSLDTYLPKLIKAGERVAVCDQLEDPKASKGIVKRGVTELVTPGLSLNDNVLETRKNNFLAAVYFAERQKDRKTKSIQKAASGEEAAAGVAFLDLSTGEFMAAEGSRDYIAKLVRGFRPSEVLYAKGQRPEYDALISDDYNRFAIEDWIFTHDYGHEKVTQHFGTNSLKGFGLDGMDKAVIAAGVVLFYLEDTEHKDTGHISGIARIDSEEYVWMDEFTIRSLELIFPQHHDGVPLIEILDKTVTAMGARLLRQWLVLPLRDAEKIRQRLNITEQLFEHEALLGEIRSYLGEISDTERLASKIATARMNPREMLRLKKALQNTVPIKDILLKSGSEELAAIGHKLHECRELLEQIERNLRDEVPLVSNQGGLIKDGINEELDELRGIAFSGKDFLEKIRQREIERTGISSLKISFNKVFGYYLEVSNAHKDKVPEEWIRKQTLVNAERYITQELKEYEEKILTAEDKFKVIEQRLYNELLRAALEYVRPIQHNARVLAMLDTLGSFAETATENEYVKPELTEDNVLEIKNGRHPVIERQLPHGERYVPNDITLDTKKQQIMIITGPNMAGKSALLRQTALIVLMAQTGSFVPADKALIGITDKIFTRVGASDNLARGESTFMVEMTETAGIMNNLSGRSLILMDEIGRGTGTYDGISIAWAIVEYLHEQSHRPKTLFATHYHELNQLAEDFERIRNFSISVKEIQDKIIFLRKLKPEGSERSFGINVAQLAGMPNLIVLRAHEIMKHFEEAKMTDKSISRSVPKKMSYQADLFKEVDPNYQRVKKILEALDINTISPVEALLKLNEIKGLMK